MKRKTLLTATGETISYKTLIVATGARVLKLIRFVYCIFLFCVACLMSFLPSNYGPTISLVSLCRKLTKSNWLDNRRVLEFEFSKS